MRFVALAIAVGALPCQAFRPWTRPAWEGVAIVKQGTSAEPSPACLAAMGRSLVIGGILMKLPDTAECVVICSSHGNDPMTEQVDEAVRALRRLTGEDIFPANRDLVVGLDSSGITTKVETPFDVARDGVRRFCWLSSPRCVLICPQVIIPLRLPARQRPRLGHRRRAHPGEAPGRQVPGPWY